MIVIMLIIIVFLCCIVPIYLSNQAPHLFYYPATFLLEKGGIGCRTGAKSEQIDNGSKYPIVMMMGHNSMNQQGDVGKDGEEHGHQTSHAVDTSNRLFCYFLWQKHSKFW